jgi:hypothetical protein
MPPTLKELARMRVVHQVPGMDAVEVRRDGVYREIDETLDWPWMNQACDDFIQAALAAGMELEVWNHAAGRHGFDVLDDVPRSHDIIARALAFIRTHTAPLDAGSDAGAVVGAVPVPGS